MSCHGRAFAYGHPLTQSSLAIRASAASMITIAKGPGIPAGAFAIKSLCVTLRLAATL